MVGPQSSLLHHHFTGASLGRLDVLSGDCNTKLLVTRNTAFFLATWRCRSMLEELSSGTYDADDFSITSGSRVLSYSSRLALHDIRIC